MVVDYFARYYARRGYVAALIHRKRLYWDEKKEIEQVEDYLRSSVIRLRQAVDWLETQPEVNPDRIGAFGISYGAVLHSMLAAIDARVKYHVLAMPAGELADTIVECPDKAITKILKKVHEERGWSMKEIRTKLARTIVSDPIYLAPYAPKNRIQIYVAFFDRVVGARRSFRLWKAFRKPELRILPFGHYGGIILLPYLEAASLRAFKKHLTVAPQS
jgi:dienelactone hydrolase